MAPTDVTGLALDGRTLAGILANRHTVTFPKSSLSTRLDRHRPAPRDDLLLERRVAARNGNETSPNAQATVEDPLAESPALNRAELFVMSTSAEP
jgi:hypothetical protein